MPVTAGPWRPFVCSACGQAGQTRRPISPMACPRCGFRGCVEMGWAETDGRGYIERIVQSRARLDQERAVVGCCLWVVKAAGAIAEQCGGDGYIRLTFRGEDGVKIACRECWPLFECRYRRDLAIGMASAEMMPGVCA